MATIEKRQNDDGKLSFRAKVRLKGHPSESATFQRLTDARRWVQSTEAAIREGRHFKSTQAKKRTLADLIDKYTKEVLDLSDRNTWNQRHYLRYWNKCLGDYVLADVTPSLISDYRNKLIGSKNAYGKVIGTTSGNRYTTALSHVFTIAVKQWEWIESNPVQRVQKIKEPRGRVRFLSDKERKDILAACKLSNNSFLYHVVVLALSTGARKNELMTLQWKDVDLKRGLITLHETKNGERRALPLQGYAKELISELYTKRKLGTDYLFPSEKGNQPVDIRTAWENASKAAGLKDFRFHDLRHSAASYLAMNGATLAEIAEVLGHKTLQMVKRYAHLSETHTSQVVASMNRKIFG